MMIGLSFITFTKNSADRIDGLLKHVRDIVDEIIVVDGYSSDETVEIARSYGAKVYQRKPWGFVEPDRMFALKQASYPWILYLDDDERLCRKLREDIRALIEFGEGEDISAFSIVRVNLTKKRRPILGPFYPDRQYRIYKKDRVLYRGIIHELPEVRGKIYSLSESYYIQHYNQTFWEKKHSYYALLESRMRREYIHQGRVRRILWKLMPFTIGMHYLYLLYAYLVKQERTFNMPAFVYAFKNSLYECLTSIASKFRTRSEKKLAEILEKEGLIQLIERIYGKKA